MKHSEKKIILGSNSPRRKELLGYLDLDFEVDTKNSFEEVYDSSMIPEKIPVFLSTGKSLGFHRELVQNEILITADTMVFCDGRILGKAKTKEEAKEMLRFLSGKEHTVITGVTIRDCEKQVTFSDSSKVHFTDLSGEDIDYYVDKYSPLDKAGSYGIQEWIGCVAIDRIEGSFFNIMGLPVHLINKHLKDFL